MSTDCLREVAVIYSDYYSKVCMYMKVCNYNTTVQLHTQMYVHTYVHTCAK